LEAKIKGISKILKSLYRPIQSLFKLISNVFIFLIKTLTRIRQFPIFATKTKDGVFRVKKKTIAFYRRPMRDISHLSILVVIVLSLFAGISASFGTKERVAINPFTSQKLATQAVVSETEKRLFEADSVATVGAYYSDALGQDASKVAADLNNKISVASQTADYIESVPIVAMTSEGTRNSIISYVVQDGDTVWTIARKFNITTDTIRYNNKLEDENSVKPGQTLVILPVPGILHTVSQGDTLAGISRRYGVSEAMIVSQNDLYGEEIKSGMKLIIPDAEIPEAPKPKVTEEESDNSYSGGGSYGSSKQTYASGNFRFPTIIGAMGYYNGYHYWAIDIPNNVGTPIFAADSGRIVEAQYGWNGGYGNTILIDHGNGYQTRYAHMSSLSVIGGYVSKGQVIGSMGSTGRSTGSHLHFEIILNGARLNPINFF
jgi:murein DD-endopeptidase MepM/ murein hydrolase activator NlpD